MNAAFASTLATSPLAGPAFELPPELEAREPAEARGTGRDDVRLLVTEGRQGTATHAKFGDFPALLRAGDVLVLNDSATIPAALHATHRNGEAFDLHLSTELQSGLWTVEPRRTAVAARERLHLAGGAAVRLLAPYRDSVRLWIASFEGIADLHAYLARHGRPIAYPYVARAWPLSTYQTVYAAKPGSAEMPSAGRPFTLAMLATLRARGVRIVTITLHAGVASLERHERPYEERFEVPPEAAAA
ncbi:MAG: S-adenosylmethionine:tRNA ribosyltransferase-isomerase, partial [Vulcanimicrobiaceae bacterium]